ncbi:outer membrane beta-barrel protein [Vibrio sp. ED004]|uniref:outer membrane protein n=1 Tax=unclassified Vibrio TaxID=2614977 RepID=UPI00030B0F08|nr:MULTISPECIES: outer membrane beta-barrel protein [unclassified Vibrio]UPR56082.1 outer membrane beta-barrel protein [Vibrio sp. ED004]
MKKLHLAALTSLVAMAATSAFASNEMYVLGGVAIDNNDIGGEFTFGSQIVQSNWYIESSLLLINANDKYGYTNNPAITVEQDLDSLLVSVAPMYKHNINNNFAIYGKLGAYHIKSEIKSTYGDGRSSKSSTVNFGATYGIGAEYKSQTPIFGHSLFLARVGYDWYEFRSGDAWHNRDSTFGIQAGFTF